MNSLPDSVVRLVIRSLIKSSSPKLIALVMLALGIGFHSATFSIVDPMVALQAE